MIKVIPKIIPPIIMAEDRLELTLNKKNTERIDGIHINKKLCRSKRIWIAVISALIVIIILAIGTGIYMIKWNREHQPEQYEFKITEESSNEQSNQ